MVERLYSEFDAEIVVRSTQGKTFDEKTIPLETLKKLPEIAYISKGIEEVVILKHEKKWANAKLYGVEESFLKLIHVEKHLVDGEAYLQNEGKTYGLIGAALLDQLQGYIPARGEVENLLVYSPKREAKMSLTQNPFRSSAIQLSGRLNYNKEVNDETLLVPLAYARELLDYGDDLSLIYIALKDKKQLLPIREKIQRMLGKNFSVVTHYEKNALIYQTSKTEKVIVLCILVFIFILAIFNLVASLTMLYIEKKDNLSTMNSFGADRNFMFRIFFYEGLLISFRGILIGLVLGLGIVMSQIYFKLLQLPNSGGQAFPMNMSVIQAIMILAIVSFISVFASYFTIYFLLKNHKRSNHAV